MISKNKEENKVFMSSQLILNKPTITLKIKENCSKYFSSNNVAYFKIQSPIYRKKEKLSHLNKKIEFSDFLSGNLINKLKKRNDNSLSFLTAPKITKSFSCSLSSRKIPSTMSIKTIEKYIKQKILCISMKLEKEDLNFSEIENNNNCNITLPFISSNKIIKNLNNEKGQKNHLKLHSFIKKEDKFKKDNKFLFKKSINNDHHKKDFFNNNKEKIFRKVDRKNIVYDSIDDSDIFYEREKIGFYILSDNVFALIFDSFIILSALFDVIFTPFRMSLTVCFCMDISKKIKYIYYLIDLLYISDLVVCFFRTQYDEDLKIIKESEEIIKNYMSTQFIPDFLEAIPIFSVISFLCINNNDYCVGHSFSFKQILLLFFFYFKQLKLIKIIDRKKNSLTNKILNIIANKYNIEKVFKIVKWSIFCFYGVYTFISIHIFIGHLSYPNWIISVNGQNENYLSLYITSFYFLLATVSTVGYGDIVCKSTIETYFQIIFLTVGVCIYSWIVSNIGNYIKNQDYAAMKCDKDEEILEEIRISYPEMPFRLYRQILQHLKSRKLRQQKCDANILINSLPYYLRNHLLLTMYKQTTNRLKICKNSPNSDFIIKLLTNFIPLFSKKNGLLIQEGELIENIVFVNDGRLALEASIDMDFPESSVYKYLYITFKDFNELGNTSYMDSSSTGSHITLQNFIDYKRAESILDKAINNSNIKSSMTLDESILGRQIGKYDYDGNFEEDNFKFINIINILKNENFGSVYMFLDKPSPLSLRVKSKKAELFLLRKFDAFSISKLHSNIWKRFQRKNYLNMVSIKNLTIKIIKDYSKNNNIIPMQYKLNRKCTTFQDIDNILNNSKEFGKNSNKNMIKYFSNSSSNQKVKSNTIIMDKETEKFVDKEQNNDFVANINKILNSKKNNDINKNQNKDINFNSNKEENCELNKNIKKVERSEIHNITINKIYLEDQNNNINSNKMSITKPHFLNLKNVNVNKFNSGDVEIKRKTSNLNANITSLSSRQKKNINFEQSQCISFDGGLHESKKGSLNSGVFSFCNKTKFSDKKCIVSGNEKIENKSEFAYSLNNSPNLESKFSNISYNPLFTNKKKTQTRVSSNSPNEKIQKNKLNSVGKIRLRFIKKLTNKIKLLKKKKNKYKCLSKSLTNNFKEYVRKQKTKLKGSTIIKNTKTCDDAEKKEIIYDIENRKSNKIPTQNNIINNAISKNNNKFLMEIPEFSSSEFSEELSSSIHSKTFNLNEISISSQINFMYKSKYKNLNVISLSYYAKSKKLRKSVKNIINKFLSKKKPITITDNKKEIIDKKQLLSSSKTDSLDEYAFQVYMDKIFENGKINNHKIRKNSKINPNSKNISDKTQLNSINIYKNNNIDENIKNIINDNNCDNNNNDNNDKNYNVFVVNVPKNQSEGNKSIIKLQNLSYLSIFPSQHSQQTVYSFYNKRKRKNPLVTNIFNKKIYNNTEFEYEHKFININNNGNLRKSYSEREDKNLIKINTINFSYIKNIVKYYEEKQIKKENTDEAVNNINIRNSN